MEKQWFGKAKCLGKEIEYYILPEKEGAWGYGVAAVCGGEIVFLRDLTPCREEIVALASLLRRGRVTPIALRDVVEDWLAR